MKNSILRSVVGALTLGAVLFSSMGSPAKADTNTTNDILYGAAAAAAAFTLYNVEHKHALATTVEGYLPDGSVVYQDGHVVSPNGSSWYPGNNGETVACSNQYCTVNGTNGGYYGYNGPNGYNNGGYYSYNPNNGGYYYGNSRSRRRNSESSR